MIFEIIFGGIFLLLLLQEWRTGFPITKRIFSKFGVYLGEQKILGPAEKAEKIMRQYATLYGQLKEGIATLSATKEQTEKDLSKCQSEIEQLEESAKVALEQGREDLALLALSRKEMAERKAQTYQALLDKINLVEERLSQRRDQVEAKFQEIKAQAELIKTLAQAATTQKNLRKLVGEIGDEGFTPSGEMEQLLREVSIKERTEEILASLEEAEDELNAFRKSVRVKKELEGLKRSLPPSSD